MIDPRMTIQDLSALADINPLRDLVDTAKVNEDGFSKGLHWLCLFVASGIEVPISLFKDYASLASQFKADLETCSMLVRAILWSCWLRSIGRQDLQAVIAAVHGYLSTDIVSNLRQRYGLREMCVFFAYHKPTTEVKTTASLSSDSH